MLFDSLDEEIDLSYIKKMHLIIGKMTVINAGSLRLDEVRIAGSSYIPPILDAAYDDEKIREILSSEEGWTKKALELSAFLMKNQLFYVNRVAEAGKAVYDLPMTANCWLDKGEKPGKYPSGGPVARMMEVWKFAAPAIDVIAPDIYVQNFCEICDAYTKMGNPLFIPETATHSHVGPRLVYTVGHHHAICFAPFGFEDMGQEFSGTQSYLFGVDTSDPLLQTPQNVEEYRWYNQTLAAMMSMLADAYGTDRLQAVITEVPDKNRMMFGSYGFMVLFDLPIIQRKDGVCLALQVSEDTFYLIANACMLAPFSADPEKPNVDLLALEEGYFEDGKWVMTRRLNGDESASMNFGEPTLLKIKLFSYK